MKVSLKHIIPFLFAFSYSIQSSAVYIYSIASNDWSNPNTWSTGTIPGANDIVQIDGHSVSLSSGDYTVKSLTVTSMLQKGNSEFHMDGTSKLTVTNILQIDAQEGDFDVKILLKGSSFLDALDQVIFNRGINNNSVNLLQLEMLGSAKLKVQGNFTYNYANSNSNENKWEILLRDTAYLEVMGDMIIHISGGLGFEMDAKGSSIISIGGNFILNSTGAEEAYFYFTQSNSFILLGDLNINNNGTTEVELQFGNSTGLTQLKGNLSLISTAPDKNILVDIYGGAGVSISDNIFIRATSDGDISVEVNGTSNILLGGNIDRTDYGSFTMQNNAELILNGSTLQTIPTDNLSGSGADEFYFSNIVINNDSNLPLSLNGPMSVNKNLNLTSGIIKTTDTNILTLKNGATITGASSTAFIDGPIIKEGTSNGVPFVFPVGKGTTYAPIEVSTLSDANSEFKAEYFSDPPPWGTNFTGGITNLGNEYWTVSKTASSENANITIAWENATGITDIDSLVVARANNDNQEWENYGNSSTTGNTTTGTVTSSSLMSDPPPWGTESFALASRGSVNALPVELTKFQAVQQNEIVYLQWETASELNTKEFIIEHSLDGYYFEAVGTVYSEGNSSVTKFYSEEHRTPEEGINYYRLKIVDLDNSSEYSHIEVVKFDKESELNIFPNPVTKFLHINGDFKDFEDVMIQIYDRAGKEIYIGTISFDNGRIMLDTESMNIRNSGTYFVRISSRADSFIQKFIRTK